MLYSDSRMKAEGKAFIEWWSKNTVTLWSIGNKGPFPARLSIIQDAYDPNAVEAIKYFLHLKAEEQYPDDELDIWYYASDGQTLEFHIHGLREQEVAVMKVPLSLYEKNLDDFNNDPKSELFSALRVRSYLSVKNTMRPEALK